MNATALYIVAVYLNSTGGGKRWYRSIPLPHVEASASHAEYAREGFEARIEPASSADLELSDSGRRSARLRRARARTRQLTLFGEG